MGLILGRRRQLQLKLQLERIMMSPGTTNIQLRALIAGGPDVPLCEPRSCGRR